MKHLFSAAAALALVLASSAAVRADQVYHTERLLLEPIDGAAGTGMVVNVHPNGPERYAIERYQLSHAEQNAVYQVWLHLYLGAADCSAAPAVSLPTAQIATNVAGTGAGQLVLSPDEVAPLRGMSFPINWTTTLGTTTTHATPCAIVTLD